MQPLISVIVPAYNNAPWLPRCLDSILAQTYSHLEILVVDDGSSDETPRILQEYAARDSRIHPIFQENGGVTSARLHGVAEATGQWIGFVDGDDEIEPQMYGRLLENALEHDADISHCGQQMIFPDGNVRYFYNTGILRRQDRLQGLRDLLEEKLVEPGLCNKLYRRELFEGIESRMDRQIRNNEDMLMNYYLFDKGNAAVFEDVCPYHYLIRKGSASQQKMNDHTIYDPILVRQKILEQCEPDLQAAAQNALVSTTLFAYAQLCRGMQREYAGDRSKVRSIVRSQQKMLSGISLKNAVMVLVISYVPFVFHWVYGAYYRFLKRR